jgi:hypothetical protein
MLVSRQYNSRKEGVCRAQGLVYRATDTLRLKPSGDSNARSGDHPQNGGYRADFLQLENIKELELSHHALFYDGKTRRADMSPQILVLTTGAQSEKC